MVAGVTISAVLSLNAQSPPHAELEPSTGLDRAQVPNGHAFQLRSCEKHRIALCQRSKKELRGALAPWHASECQRSKKELRGALAPWHASEPRRATLRFGAPSSSFPGVCRALLDGEGPVDDGSEDDDAMCGAVLPAAAGAASSSSAAADSRRSFVPEQKRSSSSAKRAVIDVFDLDVDSGSEAATHAHVLRH